METQKSKTAMDPMWATLYVPRMGFLWAKSLWDAHRFPSKVPQKAKFLWDMATNLYGYISVGLPIEKPYKGPKGQNCCGHAYCGPTRVWWLLRKNSSNDSASLTVLNEYHQVRVR